MSKDNKDSRPKPKILFLDVETAPLTCYTWGVYQQDVIKVIKTWYMLSVAGKWYNKGKVFSYALPDFKDRYKKDKSDDYELMLKIRDLLDEADIVVAHNGDQFDIRKIMARIALNNIPPPSPFHTVDTKKAAKKYFSFDSNHLATLAKMLKVGEKMETGGFGLWEGCMAGDKDSWAKMIKYNKMDVIVLEQIYERLLPFIRNHPNVGDADNLSCHICGSFNVQRRGFASTRQGNVYQRFVCNDCHAWGQDRVLISKPILK